MESHNVALNTTEHGFLKYSGLAEMYPSFPVFRIIKEWLEARGKLSEAINGQER